MFDALLDEIPDVPPNWPMLAGAAVAILVAIALIAAAAVMWITRRPEHENKEGALNPGRVTGIVGVMGSGKSYYAAREVERLLKAGRNVAGNFDFDDSDLPGTYHKINNWYEFAWVQNCTVFIDEAHTWASSNTHSSFPMEVRTFFATQRHFGKETYWISQHQNRVNKTLLELTEVVVSVRSYQDARIFKASVWDIDELGKKQVVDTSTGQLRKTKAREKKWYFFRYPTASRYDTHEIMGADNHVKNAEKIEAMVSYMRAADKDAFQVQPMPEAPDHLTPQETSAWYKLQAENYATRGALDEASNDRAARAKAISERKGPLSVA